jgi:hypothetical protein
MVGFNLADNLWNCITQNIFNFVNNPSNGGIATGTSEESFRPNLLTKDDLRNMLLSLDPSELLECIHSTGN